MGRSEAAKTCVAFFDRKVRSAIGWVPRDIFLRSDNSPVLGFSMKLKRCPSPRAQSKYAICHTLQTAITLIGLLWWKWSVQELLYWLLASNVKTTSSPFLLMSQLLFQHIPRKDIVWWSQSAWNTPIEHKSWTKTSDSVLSCCIQIHFQPKSVGATVKKKIESKFPRASATLKLFPCSCWGSCILTKVDSYEDLLTKKPPIPTLFSAQGTFTLEFRWIWCVHPS